MSSLMNTGDSGDKSEFSNNLNIFRQIEFFSGLPMEVIKLFAFLCNRQTYKAGDQIFSQDDDDQCSYYILSGRVRLVLEFENEQHLIREYESENYFGVLSLMTPMVKPLSLYALEDTTCIVMTRNAFSKVVAQFPDVPMTIVKAIGHRVMKAERRAINAFETSKDDTIKQHLGISLI
jgi:CRP/FNR family cyclic AMP-dependent transcriptional regulator